MYKKINMALTLITFLSISSQVHAVQLPQAMRDSMAVAPVGMPSLLHLVVSMAVVIGMIYVTGFIYNKLNLVNRTKLNSLGAQNKEKHRFTVLQSMPLGQQRHIYSIEMDGKIFLVGSTPNQISLIKEFEQNMPDCEITKELNNIVKDENAEQSSSGFDFEKMYQKYKK